MVYITKIEIESLVNPGCNNGEYPEVIITVKDNGRKKQLRGNTCRCRSGCSNTGRLKHGDIEKERDVFIYELDFKNMKELIKYLES